MTWVPSYSIQSYRAMYDNNTVAQGALFNILAIQLTEAHAQKTTESAIAIGNSSVLDTEQY